MNERIYQGSRRDSADARWNAVRLYGAPPGIIPFLTSLVGLYGAYKTVESLSAPAPSGPSYAPYPRTAAPMSASFAAYAAPVDSQLALPTQMQPWAAQIPKTLLQWLMRFAVIYGPPVAQAVWTEFQKRRRAGQSTALAKAAIEEAYPNVRGVRIQRKMRRRMNPTNIRALRRAVRRVRSFKRVSGKVRGVLPSRRGGAVRHVPTGYRHRRGDLWHVEDMADQYDEAEDLGYEFFREDDEEGTE